MNEPVRKSRVRQPPREGTPSCLFPDEAEIARLIVGPKRAAYWRGTAVVLERDGFPRIDPQFGGRYWPAVKAFLDARNHLLDERRDRR